MPSQHSRAENKPLECKGTFLDALIKENKPNSPNTRMDISTVYTKDYENIMLCGYRKNKPKQSQFQFVENLIALEAIFGIITESE